MIHRCLFCYQPLKAGQTEFHSACAKRIFGLSKPPILSISPEQLSEMANKLIGNREALTGVQPKLSLSISIESVPNLTLVGLWGDYILKPPTQQYPQLPENEHLTMKMASLSGILIPENTLIRMANGELAYLIKRFDRVDGQKVHVEDLCQLTETLTEHKYRGSLEKVGKAIRRYSTRPGLDSFTFLDVILFCFLTGNADMHLKNFSMLRTQSGEVTYSPAYDLVATKLALPADEEQVALTLNGKKNRLKYSDFKALTQSLQLDEVVLNRLIRKYQQLLPKLTNLILQSFLEVEMQETYKKLVTERLGILAGRH